MDDEKTIISQKSMLDDEGLNKSHASLIVLKGAEIGRDFRLRKNMVIGRSTPEPVNDNGTLYGIN